MPYARVQGAFNSNSASGTTLDATLTNPVGSGNALLVAVTYLGNLTETVTDDKGNTYYQVESGTTSAAYCLAFFYCENITNGPTVITFTLNTAAAFRDIFVDEFSGVAPGAALEAMSCNTADNCGTGTDACAISSAKTPIVSDCLCWAVGVQVDAGGISAGTGFTAGHNNVSSSFTTEWKTLSGTPSTAATFTIGKANPSANVVGMVILRPTGGVYLKNVTGVSTDRTTNVAYGSHATTVVNKPTGAAAGDVLVQGMFMYTPSGSPAAITAPTGWVLLGNLQQNISAETATGVAYYKVLGPGEPSSYTWTHGGAKSTEAWIACFSTASKLWRVGRDLATNFGSGATTSCSAVSTVRDRSIMVYAFTCWDGFSSYLGPDNPLYSTGSIAQSGYRCQNSAGSTGAISFSPNGNSGGGSPYTIFNFTIEGLIGSALKVNQAVKRASFY